jgi:hypothetical protein
VGVARRTGRTATAAVAAGRPSTSTTRSRSRPRRAFLHARLISWPPSQCRVSAPMATSRSARRKRSRSTVRRCRRRGTARRPRAAPSASSCAGPGSVVLIFHRAGGHHDPDRGGGCLHPIVGRSATQFVRALLVLRAGHTRWTRRRAPASSARAATSPTALAFLSFRKVRQARRKAEPVPAW